LRIKKKINTPKYLFIMMTTDNRGGQHQSFQTDTEFSMIVRDEHITYLKKVADYFKKDEENYLLLIEKVLYLVLDSLSTNSIKQFDFDPYIETQNYLEKMNRKSVEYFNAGNLEEAAKIITRAVDMLNQKNFSKLYINQLKLYESKILTYNNLSCIYRKLGKLTLALKIMSFALELEEKLAQENYGNSNISIISTYLNKSSILSQTGQHEKALETINMALDKMQEAETRINSSAGDKTHIQNLRMSAFYSLAGELLHLKQYEKAILGYNKAKEYAQELGKTNVILKIEKALNNMQSTKV